MTIKKPMPWGDRFALIKHFSPSDDQVCSAFGITRDELDTARSLLNHGAFRVSTNVDFSRYEGVFDQTSPNAAVSSIRVGGNATMHSKPESASRRPHVPQKRGRKGTKISTALMAVPTTRVPVEDFMREHDVSLAVLRQSRRFIERLDEETRSSIGEIHVRQDRTSRKLMIWREAPKAGE